MFINLIRLSYSSTKLLTRPGLQTVSRITSRQFKSKVIKPVQEAAPIIRIKKAPTGRFPLILKSFLFATGFSGVCFGVATCAQYERLQKPSSYPKKRSVKLSETREQLNELWNNLSSVKKIVVGIIFINSVILLSGRILARPMANGSGDFFRAILMKHFYLSPTARNMSQLIFSTFNHGGFIHLGANMFALFSISNLLEKFVAPEQFIAFYLSSGVFASVCSKTFNLLLFRNTLSVGASGAVVSCFALSSFFFPDDQFYIFPLPMAIKSEDLLKFIVGIDLAGLLLGFKAIDHAAHLGGALFAFAIFGNSEGKRYFRQYQKWTVNNWKKLKEKK